MNDNMIYIGSTKLNLNKCLQNHKSDARLKILSKSKLYEHMREIGDEKFSIELIKEFTNITRKELREYEQEVINTMTEEHSLNVRNSVTKPK